MTKPILKLGFTDTIEPVKDFFTEILSTEFQIIRDDQNPDYLIFGDRNFGEHNKTFNGKNVIKIFYTGENQRAWDYDCHFGITFDHLDSFRHFRLPLYVIYDWDNKRKGTYNKDKPVPRQSIANRDFCSFVVKNPGCEKRNTYFHELSKYKKVTAAGPLFNNAGYILEGGANAVQAKLDFLPKFKFNLCFENSSYPGYATEKVYEALIGGTVPIYWGSPTIECDFNPKAFLNWHDWQDDEAFINHIKEVDKNDEMYLSYFTAPMFNREKYFETGRLVKWFAKNVYKGVLS